MINYKINKNYKNHNLTIAFTSSLDVVYSDYYKCLNCNTLMLFNRTNNKYYICINDRDYSAGSDLSCDEMIIKDIIE